MKQKNNLFFLLSWSYGDVVEIPRVTKEIASLNFIEIQNYIKNNGIDFYFKFDSVTDLRLCDDYMSNNIGIPLISAKMKNVISIYLKKLTTDIFWHEINVVFADGIAVKYFFLEFKEKLDVLNTTETIYESLLQKILNGEVRKPVFKRRKIKEYDLFHQPNSINWKFPSALYVSDGLRKALVEENVSGVTFSKALVK